MPKEVDPVVIPPLTVQDRFTCIGAGLLYEGHARETPEGLRMLLSPNGTGTAITDRSRPRAWWIAQAIFYNIPCNPKTTNITSIRTALETAIRAKTLQLPSNIRSLETKSNREFKSLNKEVLGKTGVKTKTPAVTTAVTAKKAAEATATKAPPKKAVKAPAAPPAPPVKPPTATKPNTKKIDKLPITAKTKLKGKGKRSAPDVFDLDGDVEMENAESPAKRMKLTKAEGGPSKAKPARKRVDASHFSDNGEDFTDQYWDTFGYTEGFMMPAPSPEYIAQPSTSAPAQPPSDSVAGYWAIRCPYIQEQEPKYSEHSADSHPYTLNVVRTHGDSQIEADLNFGIARGFLRSKQPLEGRAGGGAYVTFEWVGEEEDGQVLPPRKEQSGYIKFSKDTRTGMPRLKGKIQDFAAAGDVEFEGEWNGPPRKNENRWDDFDQEAYESARIGQWG
ncbi:hypothetical protein FRB97_007908 [Tulasnella sp. 331]|nr:hypothetical protein FRB97_007908 [Tulasnella sp. 331]KAG8875336.1 hypothetical protein FRB98_007952 [Tulasnella sp. 332]